MEKTENQLKIEITQDKLVDLLLHAATREDIARLDNKFNTLESKMDSKFDELESKMDSKFDALESKMESKFDVLESKMDSKLGVLDSNVNSKIEGLESRIDRQFQKIDHRYNWIIGVNLTVGVGVVGLLIKIISIIH